MNSLLSITDKLVEQRRGTKHYMTFTFSGFYWNSEVICEQFAEVQLIHKETQTQVSYFLFTINLFQNMFELSLIDEIFHLYFSHIKLTSIIIDINPSDIKKRMAVISLPTESLKITSSDGKLLNISTCIVQFKVKVIEKSNLNGAYQCREIDYLETELELFNCAASGLITSGNYELCFGKTSELSNDLSPSKRHPTWKLKFLPKKSLSLSALDGGAMETDSIKLSTIKFHLQWSTELFLEREKKANLNSLIKGSGRRVFTRSRSTGSIISRSSSFAKNNDHFQCLVYQFIHNSYRQKTEEWDRLKCPWCLLRSNNLYILLKHLSLCHDRFKFIYTPGTNEIRIDVLINKKSENIQNDPFSRFGSKFTGNEPAKRKSMTNIFVFRPERCRPRLSEFFRNCDSKVLGKRRTYFHSVTGLIVRSSEIDNNSEDERDPIWLRQNIVRLIDDFVDVNAGEKEIMKMWNLHIMHNGYICDAQMCIAIKSFVQQRGVEILRKNLYRNCLIHMTNLLDYHLITPKVLWKSVQILQQHLLRDKTIRDIIANGFEQHAKDSLDTNRCAEPQISLPETPRRKGNNIFNRKRLRSHSICENIQKNKIQRLDSLHKNSVKKYFKPQAVRKIAKITN